MTDTTDIYAARSEIFSRSLFRHQPARLFKNWKIRRRVRALLDQDDATLNDIGIERGEIYWATQLPLTVNAAIALKERSRRRCLMAR